MSFTPSISRSQSTSKLLESVSCLASPVFNQEMIMSTKLEDDENDITGIAERIFDNDNDKIIVTYSNNMDENNIIHRVLFSNILLHYCISYLQLKTIGYLSLVNKQIYHIIRNAPTSLIRKLFYQVYIQYISHRMNINEIYDKEKNKCIHSSVLSKVSRISSTVFETRGYSSCKTVINVCTSDCGNHNIIYDIFPDLSDDDGVYDDLFYQDYSLYKLLASVDFSIINCVFKNFSRFLYPLKMLLPFGFNLNNDDTMLLGFKSIIFLHFIDDIIRNNCYWDEKMQINDKINWVRIYIRNGLTPNVINIIDEDNSLYREYHQKWNINPITIRGITFFNDYLESRFYINKWFKFINWRNNIICGSAILNAALSVNDDLTYDDVGIDIFSYNISYDIFIKQLNDFEESLTKDSMKYVKFVTSLSLYTFYLIDDDLIYPVKIKFIFICEFSGISSILLSFDMACCQLAYDPSNKKIFCTHVFLEFIRSGYNRLFRCEDNTNFTSAHRILKYKRKGISHFMIPRGIDPIDLEDTMNDIQSKHYMNDQIDYIDMKINKFSDHFSIYSSLNAYHPFINSNVDYSHMLENAFESFFHEECDQQ